MGYKITDCCLNNQCYLFQINKCITPDKPFCVDPETQLCRLRNFDQCISKLNNNCIVFEGSGLYVDEDDKITCLEISDAYCLMKNERKLVNLE